MKYDPQMLANGETLKLTWPPGGCAHAPLCSSPRMPCATFITPPVRAGPPAPHSVWRIPSGDCPTEFVATPAQGGAPMQARRRKRCLCTAAAGATSG